MNNNEHLEEQGQNKLFLSRLLLNLRDRAVRRDLADCQALHRRVLSAFGETPAEAARAAFGVLYRVETEARAGAMMVLVQSKEQPEWRRLPAWYLCEDGGNPACKSIAEKYALIEAGMHLRFRLRANPTRKIETKTGANGVRRNGKRVELRDEAEQLAWLERKGAQHGFHLCAVRAINENKSVGQRAAHGAINATSHDKVSEEQTRTARLTLTSVLFDGELIVTDEALFRESLEKGIGTGKAYGFGLLSIAPARAEAK